LFEQTILHRVTANLEHYQLLHAVILTGNLEQKYISYVLMNYYPICKCMGIIEVVKWINP